MKFSDKKPEDYDEIAKLLKPLGFERCDFVGLFHHKLIDKTFDFSAASHEGVIKLIFEKGKEVGREEWQQKFQDFIGISREIDI